LSSADAIIALTRDQSKDLLPLSIVPNAVSTAMSIAYRQLRTATIPTDQRLAARRLQDTCDILERLGSNLSYSESMVKVAKRFLSHIRLTSPELIEREPQIGELPAAIGPDSEQNPEDFQLDFLEFDSEISWDTFDSTFWSNMDPSLPTNFDGAKNMLDLI
jgi:hypothetical protein